MSFQRFETDTGNRDLGYERSYPVETSFHDIKRYAIEKGCRTIVRTRYHSERQKGRWYIKGKRSLNNYNDTLDRLNQNINENKHFKRITWIIKYDNE